MSWLRSLSILALALGCCLAGCVSPSYYVQAISGHLALMRSRVPIASLLADPGTDTQLAARLRVAQGMREFAQQRLHLPAEDSFSQLAITLRQAVTWNVVVAPEFSIEPRSWCFPVAGCVAYRGYFDQQAAEAFALRMRAKGFDVMISPAVAYSTLGWFADPLLDTMLQYSDATLAGIIFHELAHQRLYVQSDTAFSESFASFVEETGTREWLQESGATAELRDWENKKKAAIQFHRLLKESRQRLAAVYASKQADDVKRKEKQRVFADLRTRYQAWVSGDWQGVDYFSGWMSGELNNAHLALMDDYEGGICAFANLFDLAGQDLQDFYQLAGEKASLRKSERQAWLDLSCSHTVPTQHSG
jgi:predicted aminopeptidase